MLKQLVAMFLIVTTSAVAADAPRKVDFTTPIIIDGKPQINDIACPLIDHRDGKAPSRDCDTAYTVGEVSYLSLERRVDNQSWADAIKRDDLARAVRTAKDFTLTDDQRATIENAVAPLWMAGWLGFIKGVIDPAPGAAGPIK